MYNYNEERSKLFTDAGQRKLLEIRDRTYKLLDQAGAVSMWHAVTGTTGDSWEAMACVDRLVELGEIREIHQPDCAGQFRIFVKTNR